MKRLLFAALLIIGAGYSHAQERENKPLPQISPDPLWTLTNATGWIKTTDGQWLSAKNRILVLGLSSTDFAGYNTDENNLGIDNFKKWEARDVTIEGKPFLLITKEMLIGSYQYPDLKKGFSTAHKTEFWVIKKNAAKFSGGLNQAGPNFRTPIYSFGAVETGPNMLRDIGVIINSDVTQMGVSSFMANEAHIDFELFYSVNQKPENCRFYAMSSEEGMSHTFRMILPMPTYLFVHAEYWYFKQCYFELPTANLAGLIDLMKTK